MKCLRMKLLIGVSVGMLTGCGGTGGGNSATSDNAAVAAASMAKAGPPLVAVLDQPELLDQYTCGTKKVQICHVPPGNPDNRHTLCIGRPAVKSHLAHHQRGAVGDYLGACVSDPAEVPGDSGGAGEIPGDGDGGGTGEVPHDDDDLVGDFGEFSHL